MTPAITRRGFLKRAAAGSASATVAAAATQTASARAATTLDASFTAPYPPHPVIQYPSAWFVHTALIPGVVMPYDVVIANRQLAPLRDINGGPNLETVPRDATMLLMFLFDPVPIAKANLLGSISLKDTMRFANLGGGERNWQGFRHFLGFHAVTSGDSVYSIDVRVYVGPDAGPEWAEAQSIVDSIHLPG